MWALKEPVICNPNHEDSERPPTPQTRQCPPCPAGYYLSQGHCVPCPSGFARTDHVLPAASRRTNGRPPPHSFQEAECTACPAGTAAVRVLNFTEWNAWPAGSSTFCKGECGTT
jgi:hypothetical protein